MSEATGIQHSYVGTEHLLLGLLAEEKGIGAQVLNSFDVTLDKARAEVLRIVGTELARRPTKAQEPPSGEKPAEIRLILRYSNGAVVMRQFSDATDATNWLSGL
jgi:ATP-dependent Clp protease ATP-binding subunit ClpC